MVISAETATKPVRAVGGFFAITLDTFVLMFKPPFAWREYLAQCWFVARVSTLPAVLMTIPWAVISGFLFNVLLADIGAGDFIAFWPFARHDHHVDRLGALHERLTRA